MPEAVARFADRLRDRGFVEADSELGATGSGLIVFRRDPVVLRLVNDRGQWSVDLSAIGWPESEWVSFPLFHGFALDDLI
jgi:hypothetical protein